MPSIAPLPERRSFFEACQVVGVLYYGRLVIWEQEYAGYTTSNSDANPRGSDGALLAHRRNLHRFRAGLFRVRP